MLRSGFPAAAKAPASGLASAPSPSGGCTLEFAGNNSRLSFSQCQSLATAGTANNGFRLLWNLQASPTVRTVPKNVSILMKNQTLCRSDYCHAKPS